MRILSDDAGGGWILVEEKTENTHFEDQQQDLSSKNAMASTSMTGLGASIPRSLDGAVRKLVASKTDV